MDNTNKYKLGDIFTANDTLVRLKNQRLPIKISYFITKNMSIFEKDSRFYQEQVIKTYDEYLLKDDKGQYKKQVNPQGYQEYIHKDESKKDEMYEKLKELSDMEVEIEPYNISFEDFLNSGITIAPMELETIDFLFIK